MNYRLALDLGTASSCLAVIEIDRDKNFKNLLMVDDVILKEPIEHTKNGLVTSNSIRRAHRLARHQINNRKKRLKKIAHVFRLLAVSLSDIKNIQNSDIYELRVRALKEKISLAEFCRVCFYLAKHRGYKGDLKEGDIKKRIALTESLLAEEKSLAEIMFERKKATAKTNEPWYKTHEKGTFIYRKNVEDEFESAFRKQQEFYPELSKEYPIANENYFPDLKGKTSAAFFEILHSAIFYQRPIKWELNSVGKCALEKDKFRASTGQLAFQRYRIAKKLSDLRLVNRNVLDETRCLTKDEMRKIFDFICVNDEKCNKTTNTYPLSKIYSLINVDKKVYRFNFETSLDDDRLAAALKGLSTNRIFRNCGVFDEWNNLADNVKECVIEFLTNVTKFADIQENSDDNIRKQIQDLTENIPDYMDYRENVFNFILMLKQKEVFYSADFKLEHGRASYCIEVLEKLTEYLLDGGQEFEFIEKFYPSKPKNGILRSVKELQKDNSLLKNPVITRVLMQLERQLKNVISKYGNPTEVVVELARDLKHSLKDRSIIETQNKNTEEDRIKAINDLENNKLIPSNYNIEKWLLWQENGHKCPYCGKCLCHEVFSPKTEIDHIIPRAWGGANTYSNKVLCCTECNKEKGDNTPYLWSLKKGVKINFNYTEGLAKKLYKKMTTNDKREDAGKSIYASQAIRNQKALNLMNENNSDNFDKNFSDRQKHQTAWLTKVVLDWLKDICDNVNPSFGELTAYIRQRYGFATILPEVRLIENKDLYKKSGEKIEDIARWKKIFLERLRYKDIENISPDDKDAEVLSRIKEAFEIYCKELDKSSNQIDTIEKKFSYFISELRTRAEFTFDKRCDHRHHIVDAVIIGLCNQRLVQKANEYTAANGSLYKENEIGENFNPGYFFPFKLKDELKHRLLHYVPWHKPDRNPAGELFEQNAYNVREKDGVKRLFSHVDIDKIFAKGGKYIEAVVVEEYTKNLMMQALKNGEKSIFINGNKVKKVRIFHNAGAKTLIECSDKDTEIHLSNGGRKYYINSGFACCDFDKNTGKLIEVIPYWKYLKIKENPIPDNVVRLFKNDILYSKKDKKYYVIVMIKKQKGGRFFYKEVTEALPFEKLKQKSSNSIKDFTVIRNRSDIQKAKG